MDPLILPFLARYPDMRVEIVSEKRLVDIAQQGFDCGIRLASLVAGDMVAVRSGGDQQHIVVATRRYLSQAPAVHSPADLPQHPCIQLRMPSGNLYRWEFARAGQAVQVETHGRVTLDNSRLILAAVQAGLGLGYVTRWAAQAALDAGQVVQVLHDWTPPYPGLALYYPRHQHLSARMRAFVDLARAQAKAQG